MRAKAYLVIKDNKAIQTYETLLNALRSLDDWKRLTEPTSFVYVVEIWR